MWTGVILGNIGAISSETWHRVWIIIEINLLSFLPLINNKWRIKKIALLYFVVQSAGSLLLLAGGLLFDERTMTFRFITLGLLLKARMAPLHFWGASVVVLLNKMCSFVFLTWQKLSPIFLMISTFPKNYIILFSLFNLLVGACCRLGSKYLGILLFFSGLIHMRWVLISPWFCSVKYYVLYCVVTAPLFFTTRNLPLLILNLAGLPPLTGFFMKLRVLQMLGFGLGIVILAFSVAPLYAYLRVFLYGTLVCRVSTGTLMFCSLGLFF